MPRLVPSDVQDRLIVALDVPTVAEACRLVAELDGTVSFFKIGMWLFFQPGTYALIDALVARKAPWGRRDGAAAAKFWSRRSRRPRASWLSRQPPSPAWHSLD